MTALDFFLNGLKTLGQTYPCQKFSKANHSKESGDMLSPLAMLSTILHGLTGRTYPQ